MITESPEAALAKIPGWSGASWEALEGGLTNKTYRISRGDERAVMKIDTEQRSAPFNSRRDEAAAQTTAADAGVAARVLYHGERVFLSEYLVGTTWQKEHLARSENLESLAKLLQRVHALPLTGRDFDALSAAHDYVGRIVIPDAELERLCLSVIARTQPVHAPTCCHNDLVAENIVATPALMLLDWEYSADNDPYFDLATIVEHHQLSDDQAVTLLRAYSDNVESAALNRLTLQRRRYLALYWLWLAQRADTEAIKLAIVAQRLLTSCS